MGMIEREQAGDNISKPGNKADDAVDTKADARAGDAEASSRRNFEPLQSVSSRKIQAPRFQRPGGLDALDAGLSGECEALRIGNTKGSSAARAARSGPPCSMLQS